MKPWPTANPQPGEIWEHRDGEKMFVIVRDKSRVCVQRQPPGDPWWISLKTFQKIQAGKSGHIKATAY